MLKAIIVDDELHCVETLEFQLQRLAHKVQVLAKFNRPQDAIEFIKTQEFDLLFLDIEMPGMNGFELLSQIENFNFKVIFTTAYDQYAIKAIKYSALDYLLKPIDEEELATAINTYVDNKLENEDAKSYKFLLDIIKNPGAIKSKVALPTSEGLEFIEIDTIIRCQSESNYTHFFLADGTKYLICRTLKEVEAILTPNGFIRLHQSHLVNPKYMRKYIRADGGFVVMSDGAELAVSKTKKDYILELFNSIDRI